MGECENKEDVKCCENPKIPEFSEGWDVYEGGEEDQYICKNCSKIVCHVHSLKEMRSYWAWSDYKDTIDTKEAIGQRVQNIEEDST